MFTLGNRGDVLGTELEAPIIVPHAAQKSDNRVSYNTVKPVPSNHSKIDKTKILMTNGSLMEVKSIAECPHWSIRQYFLFEWLLKIGLTVL